MSELIKQQSRREYFRQYYLKNKNKKRDTNENTEGKRRGRPRKIIEPFSITRLEKPITLSFN